MNHYNLGFDFFISLYKSNKEASRYGLYLFFRAANARADATTTTRKDSPIIPVLLFAA